MNAEELAGLSDAALTRIFVEEVVGWTYNNWGKKMVRFHVPKGLGPHDCHASIREKEHVDWPIGADHPTQEAVAEFFLSAFDYSTNPNAVLPWLHKDGGCFRYSSAIPRLTYFKDATCAHPYCYDGVCVDAENPQRQFARSACIALISATRSTAAEGKAD